MTVASKQYFTQQYKQSRLREGGAQVSWSGVSYEMGGGHQSAARRNDISQKYPVVPEWNS